MVFKMAACFAQADEALIAFSRRIVRGRTRQKFFHNSSQELFTAKIADSQALACLILGVSLILVSAMLNFLLLCSLSNVM
jgi:hypothetical protein